MLLKGVPIGVDEQRHADMRARGVIAEPLFMETLPAEMGVYDRLWNVTTSSALQNKMEFALDRARTAQLSGKRKGSAVGYIPL